MQITGTNPESIELVVESGTIAYANFGITIPIDKTGMAPAGELQLQAEPGLSGEVYIDNYPVGHLDEGGELRIGRIIAGKHNYRIVGPDQTITEGPVDIRANGTLSLTLPPPTHLKAVVH